MPDTGAPWNIPYVEAADLVSDWPADSLLVANAVAAGLTAAGGLVEVKSAIKTDTEVISGVASGASSDITGLSITHTVADAANKLVILGMIGTAAEGAGTVAGVGIACAVDGTLINVGTSPSNRTPMSAGGHSYPAGNTTAIQSLAMSHVYTPGAGSKTYTLRIVNSVAASNTLYVNRNQTDTDTANFPRGVSSLIIMEVKV